MFLYLCRLQKKAKFGLLRMAVTKISSLPKFAIYRVVENYAQLNGNIRDYVSGTRDFHTTIATWLLLKLTP